jgi:predicted dehydrogenase
MKKIKLALWGDNGHQIQNSLKNSDTVELIAFGAFCTEGEEALRAQFPSAIKCKSYEELLSLSNLHMISLCSPKRSEQAAQAISALESGISVYAEKPCAMNEADLDCILAAAQASSAVFHEMAGTIFEQPYWEMAKQVQAGLIGEVIQVFAQKSYPMYPGRPLDEQVDGGQIMQNGVHAMRFIEHITGLKAKSIQALETRLGETRPQSDLKMAATLMGSLENGGLFSATLNYLNQPGLGRWGNEIVQLFGSKGMMESRDSGQRVQITLGENKPYTLSALPVAPQWLDLVFADVAGLKPFPFDLETELHPTRMVIRAKTNLLTSEIAHNR